MPRWKFVLIVALVLAPVNRGLYWVLLILAYFGLADAPGADWWLTVFFWTLDSPLGVFLHGMDLGPRTSFVLQCVQGLVWGALVGSLLSFLRRPLRSGSQICAGH